MTLVGRVHRETVLLLDALYDVYPELRPWDYLATKAVWHEADHPCDRIGRFATSGGRSRASDRAADIAPQEVTRQQLRDLAPLVPHPFTPQGPQVSRSLDVLPEHEDYALLALRAIDAVHGDGVLDMAILRDKDKSKNGKMMEAGEYRPNSVSDKPVLEVLPDGPTRSLTLIHETGHWLDDKMIGSNEMGTFNEAKELQTAIVKSQAVKDLKSYADKVAKFKKDKKKGKATVRGKESHGKTIDYIIDENYNSYLLESKELFARAYTQYVIQRGGDENLRRELASRIASPRTTNKGGRTSQDLHYPAYWEPADFEPIAREFGKLLLAKGWMKPMSDSQKSANDGAKNNEETGVDEHAPDESTHDNSTHDETEDEFFWIETDDEPLRCDSYPESWRIYADAIDSGQIAWLRRFPEHDFSRNVGEWDIALETQMARAELVNPTPRPPANPGGLHPEVVRELALSLPNTQERDLAGHPAFWVERVFAILWPQERWVHLPLTVEMQQELIARAPHIYSLTPPLPGKTENQHWSKTGATQVDLDYITREEMLAALTLAHSLALPTELIWPQ